MANKFTICNKTIHPGEVANLALPLPEKYSCAPLYMPIKVINGFKPGPCIVIFSTLRGREFNGLEIANRIANSIEAKDISGTIISIPVLNVYGMTNYPSMLPSNEDLADCFPGNDKGSYGERMAHILTHEIFKKANYCIEMQTGALNHNILPRLYCNFNNIKAKELARVFNAPVITNLDLSQDSLRQTLDELQIPTLIYRAGEARRFDENVIELGVQGVKNIMTNIGILHGAPSKAAENVVYSRDEEWIVAHKGGILHTTVSLGQIIEKNERIGIISDPFGADANEPVRSPQKGIVVGINTSPLVHEGGEIFQVVSFLDYKRAETSIEEWDKKQPDSYIGA